MTNLDEEDRTYLDSHFNKIYECHRETGKQVATNTADIGWLKRAYWTGMGALSGILVTLVVLVVSGVAG